MERLSGRLVPVVLAMVLTAVMGVVAQAPASASYPDEGGASTCGPENDGEEVTTPDGEHWRCMHVENGKYYWLPVVGWNVEWRRASSWLGIYYHTTLSRMEWLNAGVVTGGDDFSYRNDARWRTTHVSQNELLVYENNTWRTCGWSPQASGSQSYAFGSTWYWGDGCGRNKWYATNAFTWQWTGSTWNGGAAVNSGPEWVGAGNPPPFCPSCRGAASAPAQPAAAPPVSVAVAPGGTPKHLRLQPASGPVRPHRI